GFRQPHYSSCPLTYPARLFRVFMDCPVLSRYHDPTMAMLGGPEGGRRLADQRVCSRDAVLGRADDPGPGGGDRLLQWSLRLGGPPDRGRVDSVHPWWRRRRRRGGGPSRRPA